MIRTQISIQKIASPLLAVTGSVSFDAPGNRGRTI